MQLFSACTLAVFLSACAGNGSDPHHDSHMDMDHGPHDAQQAATHEQHMQHGTDTNIDPELYADRQRAGVKTSADGHYHVSLFSDTFPLPLQKIHNWTVHIETADGKPLENARVRVHGGMPAHRHGFPTQPRVTEYLGNGDYKVEGIKFSMSGHWEIRFNIREVDKRDRVVFDVHLN